jgi:hypothetical protein
MTFTDEIPNPDEPIFGGNGGGVTEDIKDIRGEYLSSSSCEPD